MFKRKEDNTEDTMFERMIVVHSLITQGLRNDHKHHKKGLQSLGETLEEKTFEANISIRANMKWDGDPTYEGIKTAISGICQGEVSEIGSSTQVKMMTDGGAVDIGRENGCFMVDGERLYNAEEAQVLVGEGAGRGRGGPRGVYRGLHV